ncbi:Rrf2 family transcriptional regulator [Sediminibacterium sp. C3]|uniref:RrF2 family transcriptional regulator n=1 Tax=Sediminibacterium sp. C3 TaxID=1267211 RepID=UPI001F3F41AC|nr:Rrf2 family transcriptional regulator [Sediminibacterium sp. C3]
MNSKKGKGGGYFYNAAPDTISLATIMRLMEGPIALLPCVSLNFYQKCEDCIEQKCGLNKTLVQVRDQTLEILENKKITDLVIS